MYENLDRPPLQQRDTERALVGAGSGLWTRVEVLERTASTNTVAVEAARSGEPEGLVVVAEAQDAGRGRLGRSWASPPRAGLTLSVLLRPQVHDRQEWGWLPLLAGLSVVRALGTQAGLVGRLKWPNDVLVAHRKIAGVLAEVAGDAVVVGMGLNVTTTAAEFPADAAGTSVALAGGTTTDRSVLLRALLREMAAAYDAWHLDGAALRTAYRDNCATLGREIRLELPGGTVREGRAEAVDDLGRLVVAGTAYDAGDVVHTRAAGAVPGTDSGS